MGSRMLVALSEISLSEADFPEPAGSPATREAWPAPAAPPVCLTGWLGRLREPCLARGEPPGEFEEADSLTAAA